MAEVEGRLDVVFMGTPDFAARILEGILADPGVRVTRVYTQPDRPAGRGKRPAPPPVKVLALSRGIEVRQPETFRDEAEVASLRNLAPDFLVVAAYGMILPQAALDVPKVAPVNVHTSILPAYRGSAPVQRALMDGVPETGVSVMRMEAGLDAGPVYAVERIPTARETAGSLLGKLAGIAAPLLLSVLRRAAAGELAPVPQEGPSTYARKISKEEGRVDVRRPLDEVDRRVRAVTPAPGAHVDAETASGPIGLVLEEVEPLAGERQEEPGTLLADSGELSVVCQGGRLRILRLRPRGRNSMDARSFLNGLRMASGRHVAGRVLPPDGTR